MRFTNTIIFPVIAVALAAPTENSNYNHSCRHGSRKQDYVAQYDDLTFNDGDASPIPSPYNGLTYDGFQVDQYDGFIPPTSGDQWAMAYGGSGNFSIADSLGHKSTFELDSFSYACVAGVPQAECAISIWGYKFNGKVIKRVITYPRLDPGHTIDEFKMNATTFDNRWKNLKSVGFSIARADNGGNIFGGLALDDVKYQVKSKCH